MAEIEIKLEGISYPVCDFNIIEDHKNVNLNTIDKMLKVEGPPIYLTLLIYWMGLNT